MPIVIEVHNLHKRYGGKVAVDDVSFTVERGEIVGRGREDHHGRVRRRPAHPPTEAPSPSSASTRCATAPN